MVDLLELEFFFKIYVLMFLENKIEYFISRQEMLVIFIVIENTFIEGNLSQELRNIKMKLSLSRPQNIKVLKQKMYSYR